MFYGMELLATEIREARWDMGLSLKELSRKVGLGHTYLSKIENGHFIPSTKALRRLSRVLKLYYPELAAYRMLDIVDRNEEMLIASQRVWQSHIRRFRRKRLPPLDDYEYRLKLEEPKCLLLTMSKLYDMNRRCRSTDYCLSAYGVAKIVDLLSDYEIEERRRVINAILALLGEDRRRKKKEK
jgi:transcriptional regulator with XRE-family HTH domain